MGSKDCEKWPKEAIRQVPPVCAGNVPLSVVQVHAKVDFDWLLGHILAG